LAAPYTGLRNPETAHDLRRGVTLRRRQNDPCPRHMFLRTLLSGTTAANRSRSRRSPRCRSPAHQDQSTSPATRNPMSVSDHQPAHRTSTEAVPLAGDLVNRKSAHAAGCSRSAWLPALSLRFERSSRLDVGRNRLGRLAMASRCLSVTCTQV